MVITNKTDNFQCDVCLQGKMTDSRSRVPDNSANAPFELVHIDLAGPIDPEGIDGHKYALNCVDSFTGLICVYFLKQKSDACDAFKQYIADMALYGTIKSVRSDQGGEFISEKFVSMLIQNKIRHERKAPYSQHQNGKAERAWRTLFDMARIACAIWVEQKSMDIIMLFCLLHISATGALIRKLIALLSNKLLARNPILLTCNHLALHASV